VTRNKNAVGIFVSGQDRPDQRVVVISHARIRSDDAPAVRKILLGSFKVLRPDLFPCRIKLRFTSLAHLLTPEFLTETWKQINRRRASGVDGETAKEFEQDLDTRIQELCLRLKQGTYKAPQVRRVEIPKGPGKEGTRPLGIPTVEDRLLQRSVLRILEAIFEADFLECSYGFRPGRNPHGALPVLRKIIVTKKVGNLFEADIRGYFNHIQHDWL
jgi:RNA-directed DNA polymerase